MEDIKKFLSETKSANIIIGVVVLFLSLTFTFQLNKSNEVKRLNSIITQIETQTAQIRIESFITKEDIEEVNSILSSMRSDANALDKSKLRSNTSRLIIFINTLGAKNNTLSFSEITKNILDLSGEI